MRRRIRCTLAPPGPTEVTPASLIRSGQGSAASGTRRRASSLAIRGCGRAHPVAGGMMPAAIARVALMSPAAPAAALVCPMLALTEPSAASRGDAWRISASEVSSARSPEAVPVPSPSINWTSDGSTRAR